ncbi:hypothetical protein DXN05_23750 [Deminuibacter soli]|uniref:Uncharacterized protein n=1 Tax=Deminuibacter soli TaxID=2291815 RepID=A0A3E1ND96_9BACT|nr:hypothetical protein DXN05_23750 [Deminuibacter soli]
MNNWLSRFVNLQPGVIKYIKENKSKPDPWFYKEAKKKRINKGLMDFFVLRNIPFGRLKQYE